LASFSFDCVYLEQGFCGIATPAGVAEQLIGDVHAPWASRVTGVLQNMPEFAEAFGCIPQDVMNPNEKCELW
jgi:predicted metalloendopeptidase